MFVVCCAFDGYLILLVRGFASLAAGPAQDPRNRELHSICPFGPEIDLLIFGEAAAMFCCTGVSHHRLWRCQGMACQHINVESGHSQKRWPFESESIEPQIQLCHVTYLAATFLRICKNGCWVFVSCIHCIVYTVFYV